MPNVMIDNNGLPPRHPLPLPLRVQRTILPSTSDDLYYRVQAYIRWPSGRDHSKDIGMV